MQYFYCTKFQKENRDYVFSNGVVEMESPSLDELRKYVVENLREDGHEAATNQIVVLAFNRV